MSYAEKLIPGANVSEQISTAGTEASGTGNMKFMLNGAVTLGTYDGANIEIVREAGEENNYIFGAREEEILAIKDSYDPKEIYENDEHIKKVIDSLVDGTFGDGYGRRGNRDKRRSSRSREENIEEKEAQVVEEKLVEGTFKELYYALLKGTHWHQADHYFILNDLDRYFEARIKLNNDFKDEFAFAKKCFINSVNAGFFSSDRTIKEYAEEIWKL